MGRGWGERGDGEGGGVRDRGWGERGDGEMEIG